MAQIPELRGVLTIVNNATKPLRAVMNDLRSVGSAFLQAGEHGKEGGHRASQGAHEVQHGAEQAEHAVQRLEHTRGFLVLSSHVNILRGHLGALNASFGQVQRSLTEFLPELGGLAVAGGLVGLFELTERTTELRSELNKTATVIGITANQLGTLNTVARLTDVPTEALAGGMEKLNRTMGAALAGKGKIALELFRHMHIALRDVHGQTRSAADVMPQLADAFSRTHSAAMRAYVATQLFGRAGQEMLPILMEGKAGLEDLSAEAAQLNYAPSEDQAHGMEAFHRSMIGLRVAVEGFSNELGAKLAPVLRPVIDMAKAWVVANREWLTTEITKKVEELVNVLKKIDWRYYVDKATEWTHDMLDLADSFGGARVAIGAFVLAIGSPLLSGLNSAIALVRTLTGVGKYLALEALWPMVKATRALTVALFADEGAWEALTVAMSANPLGMALVAALALGAAAYEVYANWDAVKNYLKESLDSIKKAFEDTWDAIKPYVKFLRMPVEGLNIDGTDYTGGTNDNSAPAAPRPPDVLAGLMASESHPRRAPLAPYARQDFPSGYPVPLSPSQLIRQMDKQDAGRVDVHVRFDNVPPGVRASATVRGASKAAPPRTGPSGMMPPRANSQ